MNRASKPAIIVEIVIFTAAALLLLLYFYADNRLLTMEDQEKGSALLDRHYAFVCGDDSDLWKTVFEEAGAQASQTKAYMEWVGKDSPVSYGIEDCMRIAVSSGVDGIILHKSPDDDMTELINEAAERDIPVITALEDEAGSSRVSYVGVNNYQMGESYAHQVLECLRVGENRILVISGSPVGEGALALMYSRMVQTIEEEREPAQQVSFELIEIEGVNSFDTEEAIRDLFVEQGELPDVMVCLDMVTTECVSQALVDYNEVGNISVIGTYDTEAARSAVDRGIIHSALGIDAAEVGRVSVDALNEYWNLGRVSSYFNVNLSVAAREDD